MLTHKNVLAITGMMRTQKYTYVFSLKGMQNLAGTESGAEFLLEWGNCNMQVALQFFS